LNAIAERTVIVMRGAAGSRLASAHAEFDALALTAGVEVVACVTNPRSGEPHPRFFLHQGKVDALAAVVADTEATLVLVDEQLSPAQERNLERALKVRVLDRTELILDIFAQRASSFEGRLEVERAQLRHLATRLVRGWTHLERQKGGIGLRGPGETQLETDRRLIGQRIGQISQRLEKVGRQRAQSRRQRRRNDALLAVLVGYTNAGKTSLFNRLSASRAYAANQLFATLDPLLRRVPVPGIGSVVIADTVGFVSHLPHELVEAFKATLSEVREADVLIHVIDAANPERDRQIAVVNQVLDELGVGDLPQIEAFNKADLLGILPSPVQREGATPRVYLSARTGGGISELIAVLAQMLGVPSEPQRLELGPESGRLRARLFELGAVVSEAPSEEGGWSLLVQIPAFMLSRLIEEHKIAVPATL
jgi:GTP-binding protein HflX